ncbi:MAG: sigma-70 family RNA polymerase sigma factor [Planctomycetota bacterium]
MDDRNFAGETPADSLLPPAGETPWSDEEWRARSQLVFGAARRSVPDPEVAAELAQETLIVAMRRRDAPPEPAWLLGVLRNVRRRFVRTERTRRRHEAEAARLQQLHDGGGERHHRLTDDVGAAVETLREPFRSVVIQRFYEGRRATEIAAARGVPAATVRVWLHRARLNLAEELERRQRRQQPKRRERAAMAPWPALHLGYRWLRARAVGGLLAVGLVVTSGIAVLQFDGRTAPSDPLSLARHSAESPAAESRLTAAAGSTRAALAPAAPSPVAPIALAPLPAAGRVLVVDVAGTPQPGVAVEFRGGRADVGFDVGSAFWPDGRTKSLGVTNTRGELAVGDLRGPGVLVAADGDRATLFAGLVHARRVAKPVVVTAPARTVAGTVVSTRGASGGRAALQLRVPRELYRELPVSIAESVPWEPVVAADSAGQFAFAAAADVVGARLRVRWLDDGENERSLAVGDQPALWIDRQTLAAGERPGFVGELVDAAGAVISGALVASPDAVAVTGVDGRFRLPPAALRTPAALTVLVRGHVPMTPELAPSTDAAVMRLVAALDPAATLRGRVTDARGDAVAGVVLLLADEPIVAGEREIPVPAYDWTSSSAGARRSHDDPAAFFRDGCFNGRPPPRSNIRGHVTHDGLEHRPHEVVLLRRRSMELARVPDVHPDYGLARLVFPRASLRPVGGWVRGGDGRPIVGARVRAVRPTVAVPRVGRAPLQLMMRGLIATTDANGRFDLGELDTKDLRISIEHPDVGARCLPLDPSRPADAQLCAAPRLAFLRVDAASLGADRCVLLDAAGLPLTVRSLHDSDFAGESVGSSVPLDEGRSGLVLVPESARRLALWRGGAQIAQRSIRAEVGALVRYRW